MCGFAPRLMFFCSPAPVQKCRASSSQTATSGVTCGRPSARTVQIQNSSADVMARSVSLHSETAASGSLNRGSISVTGVLIALLSLFASSLPGGLPDEFQHLAPGHRGIAAQRAGEKTAINRDRLTGYEP